MREHIVLPRTQVHAKESSNENISTLICKQCIPDKLKIARSTKHSTYWLRLAYIYLASRPNPFILKAKGSTTVPDQALKIVTLLGSLYEGCYNATVKGMTTQILKVTKQTT